MGKFDISDENIGWDISRAIVVRAQELQNNSLVGDFKGCVIAVIPYQSEDGKHNALKIAKQIVTANPDFTWPVRETIDDYAGECPECGYAHKPFQNTLCSR